MAIALLALDVAVADPARAAAVRPAGIRPAALTRTSDAAIPAQAGPCVAGWREMPVPDAAFISTPFEVVTRAGQPAWILGGTGSGLLTLEWTGSTWKWVATAGRGHRGLVGGVALSATNVLAVGYARPIQEEGGSLVPLSGKLVRGTWKGTGPPDPPGSRAMLADVTKLPGGKAWAVGVRLEGGKLHAYAIRWDGHRWRRDQPPSGGGAGLLAVERAPDGVVWAAGWREQSRGRPGPLFARQTSTGWKTSRGASLAASTAVVTDLAFAAGDDGWATGYLIPAGSSRHEVWLQHWDGKAWSIMDLPWSSDFTAIPRSVAVGDDGMLWIGGAQLADGTRESRGFIAHGLGHDWQVSVLDVPADINSQVMTVGATEGGAVAAANVGASILVLHSCESGAAVASGGGRRIEISHMQARREAVDPDGHGPGAGVEDGASLVPAISPAGVRQALAAPVAPKGFVLKDMSAASGIAQSTRTYLGFAGDLDRDGWTDVFFSRHGGVLPRLEMGGPGGFSHAPVGEFTPIDRHGCARGDVNQDGAADIFCTVGGARGTTLARHELTLSVTTGDRRLARGSLGIADPTGRGRLATFFKLDKDAYPELFIIDSPERDDGLPAYNRLFRNVGGRFIPAPGVGLDTSQGGACLLSGDFDGDGDQDLAYCVQYPRSGKAGLRFMRNERGKLRDRTGRLGITPIGDIDVAFADVTGDGRRDLIQLARNRLRVSKRTSSGYRRIFETRLTNAWAMDAGDVDGDHRADIYVVRSTNKKNVADRLMVSRKHGRRFVSVKIPRISGGIGDDVIALDYDRNGLSDFVVLNGRRAKPGPVKLLAAFRR